MSYVCGGSWLPDLPWPDAGKGTCCEGAICDGPLACTCWEPVYDLEQTTPRPEQDAGVMPKMCSDCAYRPCSLERQNDPSVVAYARLLDDIVITGEPFWCHNGLRRITGYLHPPSGVVYIPELDGQLESAYSPPIIKGRPYKADGTPADYCAGWSARRLHHLSRAATDG